MAVIRVERVVRAPPTAVWEAISDVEAISEVAPNVSRAEADGEGVGMHRRCWDEAGNHWDETCVLWEDGRTYAFDVDTATSENWMHRLFDAFTGTFGVDDREAGAVVWAEFDVTPKLGSLGALLFRLMAPIARRGIATMLDNWAADIEERHAATAPAAE